MSCVTAWNNYKHDNRYVIFFIEKKLLGRLDQAILDVIDNPEKNQQTTAIGTLFWQTLYLVGRGVLAANLIEKETLAL